MIYHDEEPATREHECPDTLERPVADWCVGGMFFSPAGRWETITDLSEMSVMAALVTVHTDRTGPGYGWKFWRSDKAPYVPAHHTTQLPVYVRVHVHSAFILAEVGGGRRFGSGHRLVSAGPVRGAGWRITDSPNGADVEQFTLPSKARARAEVTRRARAHAKQLGVPMFTPEPAPELVSGGVR